jgi:hypothetical protein
MRSVAYAQIKELACQKWAGVPLSPLDLSCLRAPWIDSHGAALLLRHLFGGPLPPDRSLGEIPDLPFLELIDLCLLSAYFGRPDDQLASYLLGVGFCPALGTNEVAFQDTRVPFDALERVYGRKEGESEEPFYREMERKIGKRTAEEVPIRGTLQKGRQVGLASFFVGGIEIRTLGPQQMPLGDPSRFGMDQKEPLAWIRTAGPEEIWIRPTWKEESLEVEWSGVETTAAFAFYVVAKEARWKEETLLPGSLKKISGPAEPVAFGPLVIEADSVSKMHLIPLAGQGAFWNATFLLAYEVLPHDVKTVFSWICKESF